MKLEYQRPSQQSLSAVVLALPANNIFVDGDLLNRGVIVGVMNEIVPSHCRAGDSPPSYVRSGGDRNDMRVSPWA
jgi:hypothetical protein